MCSDFDAFMHFKLFFNHFSQSAGTLHMQTFIYFPAFKFI